MENKPKCQFYGSLHATLWSGENHKAILRYRSHQHSIISYETVQLLAKPNQLHTNHLGSNLLLKSSIWIELIIKYVTEL